MYVIIPYTTVWFGHVGWGMAHKFERVECVGEGGWPLNPNRRILYGVIFEFDLVRRDLPCRSAQRAPTTRHRLPKEKLNKVEMARRIHTSRTLGWIGYSTLKPFR